MLPAAWGQKRAWSQWDYNCLHMAHLQEMPLFPLHTVLFPGAELQLNVFEDRYKGMIRHCIDFETPFGVVLIRSGSEVGGPAEPYMVGTAARVVQVYELAEGKLDVKVEGMSRFRIRKLETDGPCLIGHVEPIADDSYDETQLESLVDRASHDFEQLLRLAIGRSDFSVEVRSGGDPSAFSFLIASYLPLEDLMKQKLLEETDPIQRLTELIDLMEAFIREAPSRKFTRLTSEQLSQWMSEN